MTGLRLRAVGVSHQVVIDEKPKGDLVARASSGSWVLLALRCLTEMLLVLVFNGRSTIVYGLRRVSAVGRVR